MKTHIRTCLALLLALCASTMACGDDTGGSQRQAPRDAGVAADVAPEEDAGGGGQEDLGQDSVDVGASDLGQPPGDAGEALDLGTDLGEGEDMGQPEDVGPADAGVNDAGAVDVGAYDSGPEKDGGAGCEPAPLPPADRERVVLLGHHLSDVAGEPGHDIRSLKLSEDGALSEGGARLDIGDQPRKIVFRPSGDRALVLGGDGVLHLLAVRAADDLEILSTVQLPSADYGDLLVDYVPGWAFVLGSNSTEEGGISAVELTCDDTLELHEDLFFPLRLADAFAPMGDGRLFVQGGQALFEPEDLRDMRLVDWGPDGFTEVAAADIYQDFVTSEGVAVSPAGTRALVPNSSMFSEETAQVVVVGIADGAIVEEQRLTELPDPTRLLYSDDGQTALLTLAEPGRVVVLRDRGPDGVEEVERIAGIGLADQMAMIRRGTLASLVLLPSIDPATGSNVALLRIDGPGEVSDLGQFELGNGGSNIPGAIGVAP